jgi:phosphoglycerate dehydrogenase-like enzyme
MAQLEVAILDSFHPRIVETIRGAAPEGWRLRFARGRGPAEQAEAIAPAEVCLAMAAPMPAELLARAPRLRFIQKLGAGIDRIDTGLCARRGIAVARLHAGNAVPVAEHTLMLMLAAYRRLPLLDRRTREGHWDKEACRGANRQIHGKTVGIVGFGAIGRALAGLLGGFGCGIVYYDPQRAPAELEDALRARPLPLDELIATADIVSLHLPLTKETAGLIDARRIALMKPDALLVNCARGGLLDEPALARALAEGRLLGAALDAFATEPPVGSPLLELDNVVVTPHCAGATLDNFASVIARAIDNTQRFLGGQPLPPADLVVPPRAAAG